MSRYKVILPDGTERTTNDPEEFDDLCQLLEEAERDYYTEE